MKPLIYTTQGNLPIEDLIFETEWENELTAKIVPYFEDGQVKIAAQLGGYMVCKPTYYVKNEDGSKGELVSQGVLVYHTGQDITAEQGTLQ
jgi:hypothetical protein